MKIDVYKLPVFAWILAFWRWNCVTLISNLTGRNASFLNLIWYGLIIGFTVLAGIKPGFSLKKGLLSLVVMVFFFLVSLLAARNERGTSLFRNFLLYAIISGFLVIQFKDIDYVLRVYCYSCVIAFFAFAFLPFTGSLRSYNNVAFFGTGMVYGESVITPCFLGIFVLYKRSHKCRYLVLSGLCLALGFLLANRSTFLVCVFFVLLYKVWVEKINKKRILKFIALCILGALVLLNLSTILTWLVNLLSQHGINSYSINKYLNALTSGSDGFLSGRRDIYLNGLQQFLDNPFFGIGFGTFYERTGTSYVHSIVLDWFSTLGIIGGGIMLGMTAKALWNMFHVNDRTTKIFLCILFGLWFPRMIFSKTFADDVEYWTFMVYALSLIRISRTRQFAWLRKESLE